MSSGWKQEPGAVPERPLLPPWLRVARAGDRLLLEHADAILSLEGKAATLLLPRLLPLLDGTRTLADVGAALGPEHAAAAEHAVGALARHGCLIDGPDCRDESVRLAVSLAGGCATLDDARRRVEEARTLVVGAGETAAALERLLRRSGPDVARASWDEAFEEVDLALVAPEPRELPLLAGWNERMLDLRVSWLQVLPFNGRAAFVGPLYVPGETGCHACFTCRRADAIGEPADFVALDSVPSVDPVAPALAAALAGLAATTAVRWLATGDPVLPAAIFALELGDGLRLTRHRLLRVPRCHACSGARRLPPPLPWAEDEPR